MPKIAFTENGRLFILEWQDVYPPRRLFNELMLVTKAVVSRYVNFYTTT